MKFRPFIISLFVAVSAVAFSAYATEGPDSIDFTRLEENVLHGTLPCGTQYYIVRSLRPAYKTNFYLLNNIGSTVEEDNERGFAHFIEHMAFNGTKNFPGRSFISDLERHGVKFGYDINAYTGYDATVYNISNVDMTGSEKMVDKCLKILKDIAQNLTLDDDAIEKERKIIYEEWRQGATVIDRYIRRAYPVIFGEGNRYATRLPIGDPDVLLNFSPDSLRTFYRKWYQPQHQAVMVIGYVEPLEVEKAIKKIWCDVKRPENPSVRQWVQIPDHKGVHATAFTDKEFPGSQIDFWWKLPVPPRDQRRTLEYFQEMMLSLIVNEIMTSRIQDVMQEEDTPWTSAMSEYDDYDSADSKDGFRLFVLYDVKNRDRALTRLIAEAKRAASFGVTYSEFAAAKETLNVRFRRYADEVSNRNNNDIFDEVSQYFLKAIPAPPREVMRDHALQFLDTINAGTVSALMSRILRPDNLVVTIAENSIFNADRLSAGLAERVDSIWHSLTVEPLADSCDIYNRPIMDYVPMPGKARQSIDLNPFQGKMFALSNFAKVIVCTSRVVDNEVEFRAVRRGGFSQWIDAGCGEAMLGDDIVDIGGLGSFSANDLNKRLQSKDITVVTEYDPYFEAVSATCPPDDIETMLQLIHLRMSDIRRDSVAFDNWKKAAAGYLSNFYDTPEGKLAMAADSVVYGDQKPMCHSLTKADVEAIDYNRVLDIARSRIADAAKYTYIITGDFDVDSVVPLVERYIGSLPESVNFKPDTIVPADRKALPGKRMFEFDVASVVESDVVNLYYEFAAPYTLKDDMSLEILVNILDDKLLQLLRIDSGATYNATVNSRASEVDSLYSLSVSFECAPGAGRGLVAKVCDAIAQIAGNGPDNEKFASVRSYLCEQEYLNVAQQHYPMEYFTHLVLYGNDNVALRPFVMEKITAGDVQRMARAMINPDTDATVIMRKRNLSGVSTDASEAVE